jgi:hypothetical protein
MCIVFFYIPRENSNKKFVLAFNRDEKLDKITSPLNFFDED